MKFIYPYLLNNIETVNAREKVFFYIMIFLISIFIILLIVELNIRISEFSRELKYINSEIRRTKGIDKKRWKKARRKLYLSFFLFNND